MSKTKENSTDEHGLANETSTNIDSDHRVDHYRCPYCSVEPYTSANEREVRVHIELASDGDHGGREGFYSLTRVEAVNERGEVVANIDGEDVKRNPDAFAEICEPADDLTATERRIVATKMMHLDYSAEEVVDFLDERCDAPSEGYVRNTLRDYFETTDTVRRTRSYEEFTKRQQAAIDAAARYELSEFETQAEAADSIDEQVGYVRQTSYRHEGVVERRADALDGDAGEDVGGKEDDTDTVRRENGTGTYVGSKEGIDATMQHISERPASDDSQEDNDGFRTRNTSEPDAERNADPELAVVRGRIDILRRLVAKDKLDAEVAFDEVEQILENTVVR